MGVVYLAREVRLDRPVAIKLLPPGRARDAERFLREARTAAKLSHPNIIPIHAVDDVGDFVFFAMAYVEGETLTERVRRGGPLGPADAARVLREVAWALAYAHAQGVIHRDVKPDNILLETATGRALVADFGIAGIVRGATGLDGDAVMGTPEFMSPEQALGEPVDGRSDLYALGAVGYFALAGRVPFDGATATEVLAKQVASTPRAVADVAPGAPRRLSQLVDRCLAKDAADRPPTAVDVATQLGAALEQRRELPIALKVFVTSQSDVHEGNVVGASLLLTIIGIAVTAWTTDLLGIPWGWPFFGTLTAGLIFTPLGMLLYQVRRLARGGYGPEDLSRAFKTHLEERRELRAFEHGRTASLFERVTRVIAIGTLGGAAVMGAALWTMPLLDESVLELFGASLVTGVGAGGITLIRLQRRRDLLSEVWWRVWGRRLGRWLFRLATLGLKRDALAPALTHRPTELSLSLAAARLFEELPRETRHQLRDLPDVVHRLERDAQRMRSRLEDLQDALGGKGEEGSGKGGADDALAARRDRVLADLVAERDAVQRRLADAVAALEAIRLNLLKLHAGSATVQSLTTDLGLARDVAKEIDTLLAGQREVEELLGGQGRTETDRGGRGAA
jgi:serine/threonine-protein kinase